MSFDMTIKAGTTSKIIELMLRDSGTGLGKTGIVYTGITASYIREGGTRTAITLASGTAGDSYSSGKFAEIDATNCKGHYQLHIPNAAIAAGVAAVTIVLQASGVIDKTIRIALLTADLRPTSGAIPADATYFGGTAGTFSGGRAEVNTSHWGGTAVASANVLIDGAITAAKIASDAITTAKIADNSLTAAKFAAGAFAAVWTTLTSSLTTVGSIGKLIVDYLDVAVSSRMATFTYTAPLDAAGTRSAIGLASANLDTQLDGLPAALEAAILDEGDATALLAAIAAKVEEFLVNDGDATATIAAIATACNAAIVAGQVGIQVGDIHGKLPTKDYLTGTANADGDVQANEATGNFPGTVAGIAGTLQTLDALDAAQDSQHSTTQGLIATLTALFTAPIQAMWAKLVNMINGSSQFTADALSLGPSGGSGSSDWTSDEKTAIKTILGVPASGTTPDTPSDGILKDIYDGLAGAGGVAGPGGTSRELTLNLPGGSTPADGADVWISTDAAGTNVIAGTLVTDDFGKVTFMLDAGTYYVWARRSGMNDVLGEEWVVS